MPLSHYSGMFEPADLDLLQRVFVRVCKERGLADELATEKLAMELFRLRRLGTYSEEELSQALSGYGRKTQAS